MSNHIFSYGGIARETVTQERQPGTPVGKEKIVATVCIFIGGDPGTASGRERYPRAVQYDDSFEFY